MRARLSCSSNAGFLGQLIPTVGGYGAGMRIAVLMGGANTERDVSLASGHAVADALRSAGYDVAAVDTAVPVATRDDTSELFVREPTERSPAKIGLDPPSIEDLREIRAGRSGKVFARGVIETCVAADVVVVMVFGDEGESGHVQAVLDWVGATYVGPGPMGCGLSFDKDITKRLARDAGVATADWRLVRGAHRARDLDSVDIPGPWVVKPVRGGSTIGTTLARETHELHSAVHGAIELAGDALVERYLPGREFSVATLGDERLPVVEIRAERTLFDYTAKYQPGHAEELAPAPIEADLRDELQDLARTAADALRLGSRAFVRVDIRLDGQGEPHLMEVNGLPGMTSTSVYPLAAEAADMDLSEVCDRIVGLASV